MTDKTPSKINDDLMNIAKPFLIDCQADPFLKETARTLLNRVENPKSEVGRIILRLMEMSKEEGKQKALQEVKKILVDWINAPHISDEVKSCIVGIESEINGKIKNQGDKI